MLQGMIWIPVIQCAPAIILTYLSFHLVFFPMKEGKNKIKTFFIGLTIFCILCSVGVSAYQYKDAENQQQEFSSKIELVRSNLEMAFQTRIDGLQSDFSSWQEKQQNLMLTLATNQTYNPELRERVVLSNEQLQNFMARADDLKSQIAGYRRKWNDQRVLDEIQKDKAFEANQDNYIKYYERFVYAVDTFTNAVGEEAAKMGDNVVSTYRGMPPNLIPFKDNAFLAEIKLEKNSSWDFRLYIYPTISDSQFAIVATDSGGIFHMWLKTCKGVTSELPYGIPNCDFDFSADDYTNQIDKALIYLISAQDEKTTRP